MISDGGYAFDPNWAHGAVATLKSKEKGLRDTYDELVKAIANFMNKNGGLVMDNYEPSQRKYSKAHTDHEMWLQDGYRRLNTIIDNYEFSDKQSAAGFGY